METLWNQKNLRRPPHASWNVSLNTFNFTQYVQTIEIIQKEIKSLHLLNTEGAILSRLIYRMKSKFRSDKGLKNMEKVNKALLNYLNMSLENDYEILKQYEKLNDHDVSLPSRQNLEYILIRLQGLAKLMGRVESTATTAAIFLKSRLELGQSWNVAVISYAVISRIWILSRYFVKKICIWYGYIYSYSKQFELVGDAWLPNEYHFPKSLSKWLDFSWINEPIQSIPLQNDWSKSLYHLINDEAEIKDDVEDIKKLLSEEPSEKESTANQKYLQMLDCTNFGEQTTRNFYTSTNNKDNKKFNSTQLKTITKGKKKIKKFNKAKLKN
ncbi:hypothetical protein TKK_0010417 [Trichogramma kaykai]|uniref:Nucleolus and neural progenitor protein-like N-terminal domain-containing protein n=1 Tax=Trichogramma kaykai TaxID=54128 RepID=A0ABD2WWW7_9HYME